MAWNGPPPHYGPQANPFWDFIRDQQTSGARGNPGAGVDRSPGGDAANFFGGGGGGGGAGAGHPFFAGGFPFFNANSFPFGPGGDFGAGDGSDRDRRRRGGHRARQQNDANESRDQNAAANADAAAEQDAPGEDVSMNEKEGSPDTVRDGGASSGEDEHPPTPPSPGPGSPPHHGPGRHHHHNNSRYHGGPGAHRGGGGRCGGRGGPRGGSFRSGPYGPGPHWHHHGRGRGGFGFGFGGCPPPPPPPHAPGQSGGVWDFDAMLRSLATQPFARRLRDMIDSLADDEGNDTTNNNSNPRAAAAAAAEHGGHVDEDEDDDIATFAPPVDTFRTPDGWVLHFALPGARKDDVGVHWDADRGVLSVAGVVHRPGGEDFLRGLVGAGERSVGVFRREVALPPPDEDANAAEPRREKERDEVDGDGISASMEDGVLVVKVPAVEREWTEVRKVDIL